MKRFKHTLRIGLAAFVCVAPVWMAVPALAQCNWSVLGSGMEGNSAPHVAALSVFDDGSGTALYAGAYSLSQEACRPTRSPSGMARNGQRSAAEWGVVLDHTSPR